MKGGPVTSVLRSRNVRLLLIGQAVSALGDRMVLVALAFAVLEIGGGASQVGLVLAAGGAPMIPAVLVGGVIADRVSRRAILVATDLLRLVTQGATAVLLITDQAEVWSLAALAAVAGLGTGLFAPASTGLLPELVSGEDMQRANAIRSSVRSSGEILGPLLAGVLVATVGAGATFAIDAVTFAISAVLLIAMRLPAHVAPAPASFLGDLRDGWSAFRSRRWVWATVGYFALVNIMWAAWMSLGPVAADRTLGGAGAWGSVLAAVGVGALAGSLIATRTDPLRPLLLLAAMEALLALPLALLAGGAPVVLLGLAAFASGVGESVGMAVWNSTLQRQIPPESLGRVVSYDYFGSLLFMPIGMALWGPIAAATGLGSALWLAFGLMLALVAAMVSLPDTRRLRRRMTPQGGAESRPAAAPTT
jgi:MFS family permease